MVSTPAFEIDRFTGMMQTLRSDLLMDIGKSINPGIDRGQIVGAKVAERVGRTAINDKSKVFNTARVEALERLEAVKSELEECYARWQTLESLANAAN